jgi:hypothetical protein
MPTIKRCGVLIKKLCGEEICLTLAQCVTKGGCQVLFEDVTELTNLCLYYNCAWYFGMLAEMC